MLRDIIIAYFFGTTVFASAFLVAFRIPNLFRRLFGEGALSASFVPVLIDERTQKGEASAWNLTAKVFSLLLPALTFIAAAGVLTYSALLYAPGLSEKWTVNFTLSRIMFPYVMFICLAAAAMAVLNSYKHFAVPAFAPCLLNLILIAVMLLIFPLVSDDNMGRITLLSWAVLLAGAAQLAIQLPTLRRFGFKGNYSPDLRDPRVRKILMLMGPAALGAGITQINVLIDSYLAIWIGEWAPAALFYSERLIYFPLGIIATALGTVLLPTFSSHVADKDDSGMRETLSDSLRQLLFIMTPAAIGLLVLAPFILEMIFEWGGSFSHRSTELSSIALRCYAPGLVVFSIAKVFVPAFYSMQDTRTPVKIGIYTVLLNLTLNIIFILTLPTELKHAGMAFATVLAEAAGMMALGMILSRRLHSLPWTGIFCSFRRHLISAFLMGLTAWYTAHFAAPFLADLLPAKIAQLCATGLAIANGALVYLAITTLLRCPELSEIKGALRSK